MPPIINARINASISFDEDEELYEDTAAQTKFHVIVDRTSQRFADDVFEFYDKTPMDRIYNRKIKVVSHVLQKSCLAWPSTIQKDS